MNNYKEIVTKAVIGKTKKSSVDKYNVIIENDVSNVLGCWVINHTFSGFNNSGKVNVSGTYDINIWYSYDNNTKTNVIARNFNYSDVVNVKLKSNDALGDTSEIIVRSLVAPTVSDVKLNGNSLDITVEKELGVEIIGDTKVRINVIDDFDEYEEEVNDEEIDKNINEDYLNER